MTELDEFEYTIKQIIFGQNDTFKIELNWCKDLSELINFVRKVEFELTYAKVKIVEQFLVLRYDNYEWIIKLKR